MMHSSGSNSNLNSQKAGHFVVDKKQLEKIFDKINHKVGAREGSAQK
jgi:hypothetical protein